MWSGYASLFDLESRLVTVNHFVDGEGKNGTKDEFKAAANLLAGMDFINEEQCR